MLRILNKRSFTIMELIITVVICGILAALVAAPIRVLIGRAVLQEAVGGMTKILVAEKMFRARHGYYTTDGWWNPQNALGINWADFDGQYFKSGSYFTPWINGVNMSGLGTPIVIRALTSASTNAFVKVLFPQFPVLYMTENGSVFSNDPGRTGYPLPPWY